MNSRTVAVGRWKGVAGRAHVLPASVATISGTGVSAGVSDTQLGQAARAHCAGPRCSGSARPRGSPSVQRGWVRPASLAGNCSQGTVAAREALEF